MHSHSLVESALMQCTLYSGVYKLALIIEWYATVTFQGLTTTCLRLEYMLQIEQILDRRDDCGTFQMRNDTFMMLLMKLFLLPLPLKLPHLIAAAAATCASYAWHTIYCTTLI